MYVKEAVRQILADDVGIIAIVGTRVYGGILPQTVTLPAIVYRQVGGDEDMALDGPTGLLRMQFRVFAVASKAAGDYTTASQLAEAVRDAMNGFSGIVTGDDSPPTAIRMQLITELSTFDLPFDDRTQTHQVVTDFEVIANHFV